VALKSAVSTSQATTSSTAATVASCDANATESPSHVEDNDGTPPPAITVARMSELHMGDENEDEVEEVEEDEKDFVSTDGVKSTVTFDASDDTQANVSAATLSPSVPIHRLSDDTDITTSSTSTLLPSGAGGITSRDNHNSPSTNASVNATTSASGTCASIGAADMIAADSVVDGSMIDVVIGIAGLEQMIQRFTNNVSTSTDTSSTELQLQSDELLKSSERREMWKSIRILSQLARRVFYEGQVIYTALIL
jgi:hypothetical protein